MANRIWSSDELALLASIHANPRDDALRLNYANWLQEHGEPEYAEFIRLQCEPPYVGTDIDFPREVADYQSIRERRTRLAELAPYAHRVDRPGEFRESHHRGLPLLQTTVWGDSPRQAESLFARIGPAARLDLYIEQLDLLTSQLADWLVSPLMERVELLHLEPSWHEGDYAASEFQPSHIDTLVQSPVMDRLFELQLQGIIAREAKETAQRLLEPRVRIEWTY